MSFFSYHHLSIEDNNNEKFNLNKIRPATENNQQTDSFKQNIQPLNRRREHCQ